MHVPRWAWLSLVLVLLPGCAGRMERTVRRRAAYDLSCPKESLAVEAVKERNFAVSVYGAKGCERREEYLVRCAVLSCTTEKTSEIAAREALREAQSSGWPESYADPGPATPPPSAGPAPAPAGRAYVSMRLTNLCPQKVLLFHGRDPRNSSGRSDSIGANTTMNVSGSEGDSLWIVDERRSGLSSFSYSAGVRELFINKSCSGFSTSR